MLLSLHQNRRAAACLVLLASALMAQPSPRLKARQLLDSSIETLSSASPAIQVAALLEMIQLYPEFDRAKTMELLDQAMMTAGGVPPETSTNVTPASLQTRVVYAAADLDVNKAIELLPSLPIDRRGNAVERIALALIAKKDHDGAARLIEEYVGQGYPPLRAIDSLLKVLPVDDSRRVSLFSNAFINVQLDSGVGFQDLLSKHWRTLPRPAVEAALNKLVTAVLDQKDDDRATTISLAAAKGTANFENRKDYQLFDLIHVLREIDPKRAADILDKRPALQEVVKRFPEGRNSMMIEGNNSMSTDMNTSGKGEQRNAETDARIRMEALSTTRAMEILDLAQKDLQSAISRVKEIPSESARIQTLIRIAQQAAGKDSATARSVIGQATNMLKDIKDPRLSASAWADIADAARLAKDEETARAAIDKGIAACTELYRIDTDAEMPNMAERERWPSVQHFRNVLYRAAQVDGVDADAYLSRVNDPDLVLMGRIEIARSLMGKPRGGMSTSTNRGKRR